MTYRLRDDLGYGDEYGRSAEGELTTEDAGELPRRGRHGAHSSDDTGPRRYAYERPGETPSRSVPRHAAPSYDDADAEPVGSRRTSSASGWTPSTDWETETYGLPGGYETPPIPRGGPGPGRSDYEYDTAGYYEAPAETATAGPTYGRYLDEPTEGYGYRDWETGPQPVPGADATVPLAALGGGLLTEVRPPYPAPSAGLRGSPDAETEIIGAVVDAPLREGAPLEAAPLREGAPAEAEVPLAPPTAGGRLRFLGKKHVGLRLAAVSVLVLGAAIGITVGVLRDSDPATVKVTDDIQADTSNTAAPTPNSNVGQTEAASVADELLIKQQQKTMLDTAKKLAAGKAADAQSAAAATAKRAEEARESRGTTGEPVPTAPVDCNTYSGNKATGCALLAEFNFETTQMTCLDNLWTKESHWTTTAENPSGAYGIPQALPGSKMSSVADDWRTNPATQIRWGLGYIKGRYGTPCDAWATSEATGSY
jgi:hypothetical protein